MTSDKSTRSLGSYMRTIAQRLDNHNPMSFERAHEMIPSMDLGYAAAVLIRLEGRGVAARIDNDYNKFVRGPYWDDAAEFYKWEKET